MIERFLTGPRARLDSFLQGLSGRERALLYAATATAGFLLLWLLVYEPMTNTLSRLDRQIDAARRDAACSVMMTIRQWRAGGAGKGRVGH